ncbi:MAG TPA: hypothetical protein VGP33_02635 [Chloroflexota bacterium]|nr:hypothetical protein [Chloroflexota bacterium]
MTASPEPTGDDELARLLDAYGHAEYEWGMVPAMDREASIRTQGAVAVARTALLAHLAATYVRRDDPRYRILDRASEELVTFPVAGSPPPPATVRATGRLHTLHYDDAGNVVSGAPDFEGER